MKRNFNNFLNIYIKRVIDNLKFNKELRKQIIAAIKIIKNIKKNKKKIFIFGNGGSSAIASHFSVDLVKNTRIKCFNFNEYDLITCFSNDYGYENWIAKAVDFYGTNGDIIILISSSGKSKNIINACVAAKKKGMKIITLSGFNKNNPLRRKGDINIWIDSKVYNMIENVHQIILLFIVDYLNLKFKF
jgi:D-sedoheptulose 7-phosphate isomerase